MGVSLREEHRDSTWTFRGTSVRSGRADSDEPPPAGGLQRRGDISQDSRLNLTDGITLLRALVGLASFPCQNEAANHELLDTNADGSLDFADPVHLLSYLFLSGDPIAISPECVAIVDCPAVCE